MGDRWQILTISEFYDQVSYITPTAYEIGYSAQRFIGDHYPQWRTDNKKNTVIG